MNASVTQPAIESTKRTAQEVRAILDAAGITFADCIDAFGRSREEDPYVLTAQHLFQDDGQIEIDDTAPISEADNGNWVMAWVWVGRQDAEDYGERLKELLPAARSVPGMPRDRIAHLDWIEDVAAELVDDLGRISAMPLPDDAAPTAIVWEDASGDEFTFLPSAAFDTLIHAARKAYAPHERIEAIELFARRFGPRLDRLAGVAAAQVA